jgi:hypothetical protein
MVAGRHGDPTRVWKSGRRRAGQSTSIILRETAEVLASKVAGCGVRLSFRRTFDGRPLTPTFRLAGRHRARLVGPRLPPSPSHLPACGLACIGQTGSGNPALRHLPGPDAAPAPSDEALADLRCETRSDRPHRGGVRRRDPPCPAAGVAPPPGATAVQPRTWSGRDRRCPPVRRAPTTVP